jgi:hypothetical protein
MKSEIAQVRDVRPTGDCRHALRRLSLLTSGGRGGDFVLYLLISVCVLTIGSFIFILYYLLYLSL